MKEHPILFNGEMVRAILEGRKTMTRRVVTAANSTVCGYNVTGKSNLWSGLVWKDRPDAPYSGVNVDSGPHILHPYHSQYLHVPWDAPDDAEDQRSFRVRCRYEVGDRLWVRETHYRWGRWIKNGFTKTGKQAWTFRSRNREVAYLDSPPQSLIETNKNRNTPGWFKRPSIFMPRWASRIDLPIIRMRVERLQDISEDDCKAEGIIGVPTAFGLLYKPAFSRLWDSIYAKSGHGWAKNDWVWVPEWAPYRSGQ